MKIFTTVPLNLLQGINQAVDKYRGNLNRMKKNYYKRIKLRIDAYSELYHFRRLTVVVV